MDPRGRPSARAWASRTAAILALLVPSSARGTPAPSSPAPEPDADDQAQAAAEAEEQAAAKPPRASAPGQIELGVRLGYAFPMGTFAASTSEGDYFANRIPLWLDVGYGLEHFYIGLFFQYGFLSLADSATTGCGQSGISCSGSDFTLGADILFHGRPDGVFDPWMGFGIGYEWLNFSESGGGASGSASFEGPQWFSFQVGFDFHKPENLGFGPFMSVSLGEYQSGTVTVGARSTSGDVQSQNPHEWITFGVRVAYDFRNQKPAVDDATSR